MTTHGKTDLDAIEATAKGSHIHPANGRWHAVHVGQEWTVESEGGHIVCGDGVSPSEAEARHIAATDPTKTSALTALARQAQQPAALVIGVAVCPECSGRAVHRRGCATAGQAQQPAGGMDGVISAIRAAGWNIRLQCHEDTGCIADLGRIAITDRDGGLITILGPTPLAALTAAAQAAGIPIPPPGPDEIAWLRRLLSWCRPRLSNNGCRRLLDQYLEAGQTDVPNDPPMVHAAKDNSP